MHNVSAIDGVEFEVQLIMKHTTQPPRTQARIQMHALAPFLHKRPPTQRTTASISSIFSRSIYIRSGAASALECCQ